MAMGMGPISDRLKLLPVDKDGEPPSGSSTAAKKWVRSHACSEVAEEE
jgi:hypothetical protein